jgi:hypothetical protein
VVRPPKRGNPYPPGKYRSIAPQRGKPCQPGAAAPGNRPPTKPSPVRAAQTNHPPPMVFPARHPVLRLWDDLCILIFFVSGTAGFFRPEGANHVSPAQRAGSPRPPTPPSPERAAQANHHRDRNHPLARILWESRDRMLKNNRP